MPVHANNDDMSTRPSVGKTHTHYVRIIYFKWAANITNLHNDRDAAYFTFHPRNDLIIFGHSYGMSLTLAAVLADDGNT
jgi:hypothetical protein